MSRIKGDRSAFGWKNWLGETLVQHMEFDLVRLDVVYLEGA